MEADVRRARDGPAENCSHSNVPDVGYSRRRSLLNIRGKSCPNFHDCRLTTFPGAGHLPYEEVPEDFNRALVTFLRGQPPNPDADR